MMPDRQTTSAANPQSNPASRPAQVVGPLETYKEYWDHTWCHHSTLVGNCMRVQLCHAALCVAGSVRSWSTNQRKTCLTAWAQRKHARPPVSIYKPYRWSCVSSWLFDPLVDIKKSRECANHQNHSCAQTMQGWCFPSKANGLSPDKGTTLPGSVMLPIMHHAPLQLEPHGS